LARTDTLPTEPEGVCANEANAVVVASKKAIENFAMFKLGLSLVRRVAPTLGPPL
jgi:hypothetical protein